MGVQVERLENHPNPAPQFVDVDTRRKDVGPVHDDRTGGRFLEAVAAAEQSALSRTGRADNENEFFGRDIQIDAFEDLEASEALPQSFNLEDGLSHGTPRQLHPSGCGVGS